jgi:hypothetical protein
MMMMRGHWNSRRTKRAIELPQSFISEKENKNFRNPKTNPKPNFSRLFLPSWEPRPLFAHHLQTYSFALARTYAFSDETFDEKKNEGQTATKWSRWRTSFFFVFYHLFVRATRPFIHRCAYLGRECVPKPPTPSSFPRGGIVVDLVF